MRLLVGRSPQTVAELIDSTDVTRTAVTEQLNSLMDAGFVERTVERGPSRGRPRHVYQATHAALVRLFPGNQRLVVPAIWQAILDVGGEKLSSRILKRVSRALADYYG
jgi:predicted ArsR family transcriptional regulator